MRTVFVVAALSLLTLSAAPIDAAGAAGDCLSLREQREAVRTGEAIRPGRVGRRLGGKVLRLSLCRRGNGLVWEVTVLQGNGRVVATLLDAQSGQPVR